MRSARDIVILAAVMALGTWLLNWLTLPLVAAAAALVDRRRSASVLKAALAALLAWAVLLAMQGVFGSNVMQLNRDLAASLGVPAASPMILTLLLPAMLAASAAGTVAALRRIKAAPATQR